MTDATETKKPGVNAGKKIARDLDGFTPKMREAIPVIAFAKSEGRGIQECVDQGIVSSRSYFFSQWWKDPAYKQAVKTARAEVWGNSFEASKDRFLAHAEDMAEKLLVIAFDDNHKDQVKVLFGIMDQIGYQFGYNRVNVQTNVAQGVKVDGADVEQMSADDLRTQLKKEIGELKQLENRFTGTSAIGPRNQN